MAEQVKVAINGFGRIGRTFFKQAAENPAIDLVAINDLGDINDLAYLLKYDSVTGRYNKEVAIQDGNLVVGGKTIKFLQQKDPAMLPWGDLGIDVVIESTGFFTTTEKSQAHIKAGAKRVIISAPAEDGEVTPTATPNVNISALKDGAVSSNGSCTTNATTPIVSLMMQNPGIEKAILNTVHAYTATQSLVDGPTRGHDFRKGRSASNNIVPSHTGAAISVGMAIPGIKEKFDGVSMRVPVIAGSIIDFTFVAKRKTSVEEINSIFTQAAQSPEWQGVLKVTTEPLVSRDILGEPYGSIVDLSFTRVVDGDLVKIFSWYDNEYGYCAMLLRHTLEVAKLL